ncbi:hypothetical protein EKO04_008032 [Ascochyta lentis]|uniref:Uncharacterized protein n=1 Tax=Ascochyta lentis TaxID=205686 RepID=A0A8H7MGH6_9PLEO|nr:hypothetical protein EKO04_008032 [Ascochyta lentis]
MPNIDMIFNQQRDSARRYANQGAAGSSNYDPANRQQQAGGLSAQPTNAVLDRSRREAEVEQQLEDHRNGAHGTQSTWPHLRGGYLGVENHTPLHGYRRPSVEDDIESFDDHQIPQRRPAERDYLQHDVRRRRQETDGGRDRPRTGLVIHANEAAGAQLNGWEYRRMQREREENEVQQRELREHRRLRCEDDDRIRHYEQLLLQEREEDEERRRRYLEETRQRRREDDQVRRHEQMLERRYVEAERRKLDEEDRRAALIASRKPPGELSMHFLRPLYSPTSSVHTH